MIIDSQGLIGWTWQEGREFCQTFYKTDYFAINSLKKQVDIMIIAYENNIKDMAWIGLSDDMQEGEWIGLSDFACK